MMECRLAIRNQDSWPAKYFVPGFRHRVRHGSRSLRREWSRAGGAVQRGVFVNSIRRPDISMGRGRVQRRRASTLLYLHFPRLQLATAETHRCCVTRRSPPQIRFLGRLGKVRKRQSRVDASSEPVAGSSPSTSLCGSTRNSKQHTTNLQHHPPAVFHPFSPIAISYTLLTTAPVFPATHLNHISNR